METLNYIAEKYLDGLYDSRLPEGCQCTGWKHLKQLVESGKEVLDESDLTPFHEVLRPAIKNNWHNLRRMPIEE